MSEIILFTAPYSWCSLFVNGDDSGMEQAEIDEVQAIIETLILEYGHAFVSPNGYQEPEFMAYPDHGLAGDCITYAMHVDDEHEAYHDYRTQVLDRLGAGNASYAQIHSFEAWRNLTVIDGGNDEAEQLRKDKIYYEQNRAFDIL